MKLKEQNYCIGNNRYRYPIKRDRNENGQWTAAIFLAEDLDNRPFPSYLKPLFQSEAWCTTIHMKMSLICM